MAKEFEPTLMDLDTIVYRFKPNTKFEYLSTVNYFDDIPLELGDYISYPHEIVPGSNDWLKFFLFLTYIPATVADHWLSSVDVDTNTNKLMQVVDIRTRYALVIYKHDSVDPILYKLLGNRPQ